MSPATGTGCASPFPWALAFHDPETRAHPMPGTAVCRTRAAANGLCSGVRVISALTVAHFELVLSGRGKRGCCQPQSGGQVAAPGPACVRDPMRGSPSQTTPRLQGLTQAPTGQLALAPEEGPAPGSHDRTADRVGHCASASGTSAANAHNDTTGGFRFYPLLAAPAQTRRRELAKRVPGHSGFKT